MWIKFIDFIRYVKLVSQIHIGTLLLLLRFRSFVPRVESILFDFQTDIAQEVLVIEEIESLLFFHQTSSRESLWAYQNSHIWFPRRIENLVLIGQPESIFWAMQIMNLISRLSGRANRSKAGHSSVKLVVEVGTITSEALRRRTVKMSRIFDVKIFYASENFFPVTRQQAESMNQTYPWLQETSFAEHLVWTHEFSRALRRIESKLRTRVCGPVLITNRTIGNQGTHIIHNDFLNVIFFDVPALRNLESWNPYHWKKGVAILDLFVDSLEVLRREFPITLFYKSKRGLDSRHASEYLRAVNSFLKHSNVIEVDSRTNVRDLVQRTQGTFSTLGTSTALVARHFNRPSKYVYADNSDTIQFFVDYGIDVVRTSNEMIRIMKELNTAISFERHK